MKELFNRAKSLRVLMAVATVVVLITLMGIVGVMTVQQQEHQMQIEMLEKARILRAQMGATWDYIEEKQEIIEQDSDGSRRFKGVNCAIAGKEIGQRISDQTDYQIAFTNFSTRNANDSPNDFELEALREFANNPTREEYFARSEDGTTFRYAAPLWIEESCLDCHGGPLGEIDPAGFPKEGRAVGDLAGIMSIGIPTKLYSSGLWENILRQIAGLGLAIVAVAFLMFFLVSHFVTNPLSKLERFTQQVSAKNFDVGEIEGPTYGEVGGLVRSFTAMATDLKATHEDLEKQVEDRTRELSEANSALREQGKVLQRANEQLAEESERKSDFLAMVSHDLRTPLTSIIAYADLGLAEASCEEPEAAHAFSEIKGSGKRLLTSVNNILEMAQAEAGKLVVTHEPVDMVDVANELESMALPLAKKNGLEWSLLVDPRAPVLYSDGEKIREILENLVSNAIKFTDAGGYVTVEIECEVREEEECVVAAVSDSGCGIPHQDIDGIFESFGRGQFAVEKEIGGTGLGLSVALALANALGGSIEAASRVGVGSRFALVLPAGGGVWKEME